LLSPNRLIIWNEKDGIECLYNAGFIIFRNDSDGRRLLSWWTNRCLEWCREVYEDGKLGEQLYLNEFEKLSSRVVVHEHRGANVSYWNLARYYFFCKKGNVWLRDKDTRQEYPLVFFHMSGFRFYEVGGRVKYVFRGRDASPVLIHGVYDHTLEGFNWALNLARTKIEPHFTKSLVSGATLQYYSERLPVLVRSYIRALLGMYTK
ncbi:MAG: hypothetical protein KGJ33_01720, partial [Patescibacteria group bacterium]|nr:hypothetical protein [Patescibacteria group bacterium]